MGFLIDTNIWIAIERGRLSVTDIHAVTRKAPIYLSPVNLGLQHPMRTCTSGKNNEALFPGIVS